MLSQSLKEVGNSVNMNRFAEEEYIRICDKVEYWFELCKSGVKEVNREIKRIVNSVRRDPDMRHVLDFVENVWSVCERGVGEVKKWLSKYVWKYVKECLRPMNGVWLKVKEVTWKFVSWLLTNGVIFVDSTWFVLNENPVV